MSPPSYGMRSLLFAQHRCQSPFSLPRITATFIPLCTQLLAVHLFEACIRLFRFSRQQCSIVAVGLANYVSQEVGIRFRCTRLGPIVCQTPASSLRIAHVHFSVKGRALRLATHLLGLNASIPTSSYFFVAFLASCTSSFAIYSSSFVPPLIAQIRR